MDLLAEATKQLESAQNELAASEIAAIEANSRAEEARNSLRKLEAAVAALSGESPPATSTQVPEKPAETPQKQAEQPHNPLAHVKCSGCGTPGSMAETYIQSPSGSAVRSLVCGKCGNQSF